MSQRAVAYRGNTGRTERNAPEAVYLQFGDRAEFDVVDYDDKQVQAKFSRLLLSLRKKHLDGDLLNENSPDEVVWQKSAAKQYLKKCFRQKTISVDFTDHEQVWKDFCKDHRAFARMKYNESFKRRLDGVRKDYEKKLARAEEDLRAFEAAKKNHPTPPLNHRGEPQWHGSEAEKLRSDIRLLRTQGETLRILVNDFLDLAKIEQGKLKVEKQAVELAKLIGETRSLMEPLAQEKGLSTLKCSTQV